MKGDLLDQHLKALPYFRATLRSVEARLMGTVTLPRPILDIGAGDGHFASVTYPEALDVGVDPHFPSLVEAGGRAAYHWRVQADAAHLPHATASFGSAISNSVLEHIFQLDAVLSEVGRVLRPGAPFAITVPNPGYRADLSLPASLHRLGLHRPAEAYRAWFMRMSRTWNLLDERGWQDKLSAAGFEIVNSQRYFSPEALHILEWGHYFGGPCVVCRWLTGRWILAPTDWNLGLTDRLVRKYFEEPPQANGTYTFYLARRRA
jgi:SAM-dependent methyltransferase